MAIKETETKNMSETVSVKNMKINGKQICHISKSLDTIRRMDEIIMQEAIGLIMGNSKGFADFQLSWISENPEASQKSFC